MVYKTSISELGKATPQAVSSRCDVVVEAFTKYAAIFVNPNPDIPTLTASNAQLKVAILNLATLGGGKQAYTAVRACRAGTVGLLRLAASYVTSTADGDMETLLKGGFPIQKPTRTPIGQLVTPDAPTLSLGKYSGELNALTTPRYGGMAYNWRIALDSAPDVYVQTLQTTAASVTFKGLTPGELYDVDCSVVGAAGPTDFSDVSTAMVI